MLLLFSMPLLANNLHILSAHSLLKNNIFILNASVQYTLTSAQKNALHNGLPVMVKFRVEFLRERMLLNEEITKLKQRYTLTYRAITRDYHIKNHNSGAETLYPDLRSALQALGRIVNYPLIDKNILDPGQTHYIRIRAYTDVIDLPITVKLINYFSDKWSQTSDWYTWALAY